MGNKRDIYYLEICISYKKGKTYTKLDTWAVSKFTTAHDIMKNDSKTMGRLNDLVYGHKYKSVRQLVITKIFSIKKVGESLV